MASDLIVVFIEERECPTVEFVSALHSLWFKFIATARLLVV